MLKNAKGITMMTLITTIIVLLILVGISATAGYSIMKNMRVSRMIANMSLIKAKVETIYEEYLFYNNDANYLIGEGNYHIDSTTNKLDDIEISNDELELIANEAEIELSDIYELNWYKWDSDILKSQGLNPEMLSENEFFYINYENEEIIYSKGILGDQSNEFYSMTGLNTMK